MSIDKSLHDAAFIPDVGGNGFTTVMKALGGFYAWPKEQVILEDEVHTCICFINLLYIYIYNFSYLIQYLIHPAFCFLQATPPPSTIQMISEHNKDPPKITGKRNYVSLKAMQSEADRRSRLRS